MNDPEYARMLAVSSANALLKGEQIALITDAMADFADAPAEFKDLVARHFGLDFFDEFFWKEPFDFREIVALSLKESHE